MSRYGLRSRLTGAANANTINYWFGGGFFSTDVSVDYLVVAGGGGGPGFVGYGGGGAGGLRSTVTATGGGGSLETALSLSLSTNYTVTGEQLGCINSATANIVINSNLSLSVNTNSRI